MNKLVQIWSRPRAADSIDTVEIDGEKRIMANRARLPNEVIELPRSGFFNIIRLIHKLPLDHIAQIRSVTYETLKRLGVKRDLEKAVTAIPKGSSQVDVGTIVAWMRKIQAKDKRAIRQLVAIDATVCKRGE